ncbi:MAG: hypothetical protein OEZ01_04655 [Candidatus Heimdallarchaeota archaeon]|nr:hypothetical protein [Candidatus Heimdallarchaeota archaeon]
MQEIYFTNKLISHYKKIVNDTDSFGSDYWSIANMKLQLLRELRGEIESEECHEQLLNDQYNENNEWRVY